VTWAEAADSARRVGKKGAERWDNVLKKMVLIHKRT